MLSLYLLAPLAGLSAASALAVAQDPCTEVVTETLTVPIVYLSMSYVNGAFFASQTKPPHIPTSTAPDTTKATTATTVDQFAYTLNFPGKNGPGITDFRVVIPASVSLSTIPMLKSTATITLTRPSSTLISTVPPSTVSGPACRGCVLRDPAPVRLGRVDEVLLQVRAEHFFEDMDEVEPEEGSASAEGPASGVDYDYEHHDEDDDDDDEEYKDYDEDDYLSSEELQAKAREQKAALKQGLALGLALGLPLAGFLSWVQDSLEWPSLRAQISQADLVSMFEANASAAHEHRRPDAWDESWRGVQPDDGAVVEPGARQAGDAAELEQLGLAGVWWGVLGSLITSVADKAGFVVPPAPPMVGHYG